MFELEVPFLEKDQVKQLGARWNAHTKKWFVPSGIDPANFRKWWPKDAVPPDLSKQQHKTLLALLNQVRSIINDTLPNAEWVIAEVSEVSSHNNNHYITLVEYNEQGHKCAQVNGCVWKDQVASVFAKFEKATGSKIEPGIKILVFAKVTFHPQYGISLTIQDIDPSYTLGDMAAKLAKIRQVLQEEKIFNRNKQLPIPVDFTRVAVISPKQAAGLGDFRHEANLLEKHKLCEFIYFTATFQGKSAPEEIITEIDKVILEHQHNPFDALVIIRGGGAVADLMWLNDLELAKKICLSPLFVMVGIGHERDCTILDEIAAYKFDTPSKVIVHIFRRIVDNAENASNNFNEIIKISKYKLQVADRQIVNIFDDLLISSKRILQKAQQTLEMLIREILCQGPDAVLKRGFAMVSSFKGKIITSCKEALKYDKFKLNFHDSSIIVKHNEVNHG